jgi:hypothetical protein
VGNFVSGCEKIKVYGIMEGFDLNFVLKEPGWVS